MGREIVFRKLTDQPFECMTPAKQGPMFGFQVRSFLNFLQETCHSNPCINHQRTLLRICKVSGCSYHVVGLCSLNGGCPKIWDTFFGVSIVRIVVF